MQTVNKTTALRSAVNKWRRAGVRVALVPTMGNLHAGHMALIKRARELATRTVVSIFVNPMQFVKGEDYDRYPRTPEQDLRLLSEAGVDLVFMPEVEELYAHALEHTTRVQVPLLDTMLCGEFRPGHFTGVATIVAKLFNLAQPDLAVFGDKDYQQLQLIRRMVADLRFPIDIVAVATVRDVDGLALSSRNNYLIQAERASAPLLYQTLKEVAAKIAAGAGNVGSLETGARSTLEAHGFRVDYVAVRRAGNLMPTAGTDTELVVLAAAWLGRTRLIDHVEVSRAKTQQA